MRKFLKKNMANIILSIIALLFIWPLLWLVIASFDAKAPLSIRLPEAFTLDNYKAILTNPMNYRSFINSFIISFTQSSVVVILSILAAYPLSRYKMKHKQKIMYSILFLTGLPITAIMVPVYMMFFRLKIINSLLSTSLFLAATSLPYGIWMMKNFIDDVPIMLEESAWIDGASALKTIKNIVLPLVVPGLFVLFIYTFSGSWGNFYVPFVLISSAEKMPAAVSIYQFFGSYGKVAYGQLATFSLLYTLPIVMIYFISQKFMSNGFNFGGSIK